MVPGLFEPVEIGTASAEHIPYLPLVAEYYAQPATRPGTLLIIESTLIAARAGGLANVPGIWSPAHIGAWRELWALGRVAEPTQLTAMEAGPSRAARPRALSVAEIEAFVAIYAQPARNAIAAGFDAWKYTVSLALSHHAADPTEAANGYLPVHFLQDISNTRTDTYGGSIANRARLSWGSPTPSSQPSGPSALRYASACGAPFTVWVYRTPSRHSATSYLRSLHATRHSCTCLIEPRISRNELRVEGTVGAHESNDALRAIWAPRPPIRAGGFDRASALAAR
ncbi:FMN-linked oxidoreductase [Mycena albidolilacea]|uniref:FMN-linked oxidoreductase n=1 Tax=Mycena albidolilacea TaxID=1033008 RepID=A0AAD7AFB9_9AGAR|nr:FMN-linked oxidoreductase [Mycena albidolilacea]